MTSTITTSFFHQWLLKAPQSAASACTIMLHGDCTFLCERLIGEITEYLNEYDDDGEGRWLAVTPELIHRLAHDVSLRQLLGLSPGVPTSAAALASETIAIMESLGQRGHVVMVAPDPNTLHPELPHTFHAGVGGGWGVLGSCHLILNPKLLGRQSLAHIVGDVFLDWLHHDEAQTTPFSGG